MRKIERNMLRAIIEGRDWMEGNTCVCFSDHVGNPYLDATVYLHGNPIAEIKYSDGDELPEVWANQDTFYRWPTMTTGSRLHALGVPNKASRDGDPKRAWVSEDTHTVRSPHALA